MYEILELLKAKTTINPEVWTDIGTGEGGRERWMEG